MRGLRINGGIIAKLIIKKLDVSMCTEVIWLRIGFSVRSLGNTVINNNIDNQLDATITVYQ